MKKKKDKWPEDHDDMLEIDEDSEHPVHEKYVKEKKVQRIE
jgi:hypothetical protein